LSCRNRRLRAGPIKYPETLDVGKGFVGETLGGTLTLENTSSDDLWLEPARSSCSCLLSLTKPTELAAGATLGIKVALLLKDDGVNEQRIFFPVRSHLELPFPMVKVRARGVIPFCVVPERIDFGVLSEHDLPVEREVSVKVHPGFGTAVVSFDSDMGELEKVAPDRYRIVLRRLPGGMFLKHLVIVFSGHPQRIVTVPISARMKAKMELTQKALFVGPVRVGSEFRRTVRILTEDRENAPIARNVANGDPVEVKMTQVEDGAWDMMISGRCSRAGVTRDCIEVALGNEGISDYVQLTVIGVAE
jgi:hypothetical protein